MQNYLGGLPVKQLSELWFPHRTPSVGASVRLFCFPFSGGNASAYGTLTSALPTNIDVCAIQLPGRGGRLREAPVAQITQLVSMLADGLAQHLDHPYAFFGHSMGALIAFELTRELRRRGRPLPLHLFASACAAPNILDRDQTHKLSDDQLIERLRALGGTSDEVLACRELMAMIIPVMRADAAISEGYEYQAQAPLSIPITAFCGLMDEKAPQAQMEVWQQHTTRTFHMNMVPGGHMFLLAEELDVVAAAVGQALDATCVH